VLFGATGVKVFFKTNGKLPEKPGRFFYALLFSVMSLKSKN